MSEIQNKERNVSFKSRVNTWANRAAVVAMPIVLAATAHAADADTNTIDIGTLGLVGLSASAATVFGIKASPSLMMWGYRKILGFIGR